MRTRSSTVKRLLKLITGISLMTLCAAPAVFAAQLTSTDPLMSKPFLNYSSQVSQAFTNTVPNALASYYTYQPFTAADAALLGFPNAGNTTNPAQNPNGHICGIAGVDVGSTADCYIISVRQFRQPASLDFLKFAGIGLFTGNGLLGTNGLPLVDTTNPTTFLATLSNATNAWGYGSGGAGWQPYFPNTTTVRGNAPGAFQNVTFAAFFGPGQNSDTAATGVWHFPAPTIKGTGRVPGATTGNRPVYIQWLNDLPDTIPPGHDPTVDCGVNAHYCYPYNRIVTHVHGAHVNPQSDGLATAWYTPNFAVTGEGTGLYTGLYASTSLNTTPIYYYPMDQEAATIWYHDHAIGSTHLNTNQGMAGFFPITDAQEQALQAGGVNAVLPSGDTYELGFALQDRNFDTTGQMIMPDYAIYDKTNPSCTYLDAPGNSVPDPANPNCVRVPFLKMADTSVQNFHLVPLGTPGAALGDTLNPNNPGVTCTSNVNQPFPLVNPPLPECAPFGATSATLEYFGNIPVVNGVTYGVYNVSPGVYRMRFIGGTDSRAWILQLQDANANVIPFWQIGSEQGLLDAPVSRTMIDLMGGERIDVLVDFNALAPAGGRVILKDLGEDAPYAGSMITDPAFIAPNASSVVDVMAFDVAAGPAVYNSTNPASITNLRPSHPLPALGTPTYTRNIALIEITDMYGRTMPTIDARGYRPAEIPISENILINEIEQWDIINTTVDAHPMHLHQVAFQLIDRQAVEAFAAPITPTGDAAFAQPYPPIVVDDYVSIPAAQTVMASSQYAPVGGTITPQAYETRALKDTIDCPPSYVTRIITKFDILGTYVWHCHILSHEEHDMMRPFRVVAAKLNAPASITVPATANSNGTVNVSVAATTTAPSGLQPYQYVVQFKKTTDTFWTTSNTNVTNPTINLTPYGGGTYQFRAQVVNQILQDTATTNLADSNWVAGANTSVYTSNLELTPAGAIGNTPLPTYTWTDVPGAITYTFLLRNSANTALLYTPSVPADCTTVPGTCTYTPASSLATGSYSWFVRAVTAAGNSAWGTGKVFNVLLPTKPVAVTLGTPAGAIGDTPQPTYSWTQDSNATSYTFLLRNSANTALFYTPSVPADCTTVPGTCTYTPTSSLATGSYTWFVQAVNAIGAGPWGAGNAFNVTRVVKPGVVTLLSPNTSGTSALPTYSWSAVSGATSYTFLLRNSANVAMLYTPAVSADCTTVPGTCSVTPALSLPTPDNYTWFVRAANSAGAGPWGVGMSFSRP